MWLVPVGVAWRLEPNDSEPDFHCTWYPVAQVTGFQVSVNCSGPTVTCKLVTWDNSPTLVETSVEYGPYSTTGLCARTRYVYVRSGDEKLRPVCTAFVELVSTRRQSSPVVPGTPVVALLAKTNRAPLSYCSEPDFQVIS